MKHHTPHWATRVGLALGLALGLSGGAHAELSPQLTACMDRAGGNTQGMVECMGAETRRQDARLNQAYKALMDATAAERKKQLQEAQRAWVRFRDTNCAFYLDPQGGSMARVSASDCVLTMTVDRADELETLAE